MQARKYRSAAEKEEVSRSINNVYDTVIRTETNMLWPRSQESSHLHRYARRQDEEFASEGMIDDEKAQKVTQMRVECYFGERQV